MGRNYVECRRHKEMEEMKVPEQTNGGEAEFKEIMRTFQN